MFIVECNANKAWCGDRDLLTTGTVGKTVDLRFSDDWDGLQKFAVFRAYDISEAVVITGDTLEIPRRVLSKPDVHLMLGIYGVNTQGTVAIPTVYADLGCIREGANITGADNYEAPEESMLAEMQAMVETAQAAAIAATSGAVFGTASFSVNSSGHLIMAVEVEGETSTTDLGIVTAYAEAVAGGYTGTYAEFQALLTANARTAYDVDAALAAVEQVVDTADAASAAASAASTAAASAESAATAAQAAVASKQAQHKTATVTLASGQSSWSNLSVTGVTANNTVIVTPAPASFAAWVTSGVYCSGQGAGTLSFAASATPSAALTANIVILD